MYPLHCTEVQPEAVKHNCIIRLKFYRVRKTGPELAIAVCFCETHGKAFSVYPPGHFPYGRQPLVPITPAGIPVRDNGDTEALSEGGVPKKLGTSWKVSIFAAAMDAVAGIRWRGPQRDEDESRHFSTQAAHLKIAGTLLGLDVEPDKMAKLFEVIGRSLEVPLLRIKDSGAAYRSATDPAGKGSAILGLLVRVSQPPSCALDRLLASGALNGRWGHVFRWKSGPDKTGPPRCKTFRSFGTSSGQLDSRSS